MVKFQNLIGISLITLRGATSALSATTKVMLVGSSIPYLRRSRNFFEITQLLAPESNIALACWFSIKQVAYIDVFSLSADSTTLIFLESDSGLALAMPSLI